MAIDRSLDQVNPLSDFSPVQLERLKFFRHISPTLRKEEFSQNVLPSPTANSADHFLKKVEIYRREKVLDIKKEVEKKLFNDDKSIVSWGYEENGIPNTHTTIVSGGIREQRLRLDVKTKSQREKGGYDAKRSLTISYKELEEETDPREKADVEFETNIYPDGNFKINGRVMIGQEEVKSIIFDSKEMDKSNIEASEALEILTQLSRAYLDTPSK